MTALRIELCGEVRVEIEGRRRERQLPGRLGRVLLGYLVLNRRRAIARDELIEALWPGEPPDDPGATLSTLLSGVRRALGPGMLTGRAEVRLVLPQDAWIDVEALDGLRADAALEALERVLLPGFDAPWLDQRRRERDERRLEALEALARAGELPAARRLVELAPFRESGYSLLMQAQAAEGNVAEALQTYERARELMRDELGTAPSAELRAVHERLLAPRVALPAPLARAAERRFVGRIDALRVLREPHERRFVLIAGEPGIGKTSLAATFAREAHEAGATVLYGRSDEDALAPYQPFAELLPDGLPHPASDRYRLFEAVAAGLARLPAPLVLVCDDLHWADRPTLLLVRHLARAAQPARLLFLGTYRDAEAQAPLRELIADLRREHALAQIRLDGLDEAETGDLTLLPAPAARRLRELTGGNPLFLGELLRAGIDEVPEGIREVVLRRVDRADAREALTLAAVAGQTFRAQMLGDEALDALDRALAAGLLVAAGEPDRLAFAHALIRQTLYEGLSETRRVRLHRQVAETLERLPRPDPAELAHHFFRARHVAGPEPAIRYARQAAARAAASLAWEDEALQLERALEAGPANAGERIELLLALGEARLHVDHAAARAVFLQAAGLARGRSPRQFARAAIGYGGRYYEAGIVDPELLALLREALEGIEGGELRAHLLARLAEILHFAGAPAESLRLSAEALALREDAVTLTARQIALLHAAHTDERIEVGRRLLALAERTGDGLLELQSLHSRVFDRLTVGDVAGAREAHARLEALARARRDPLHEHLAVGWAGTFAQLDGRYDEAERLALESYELRKRLETRDAENVLAGQLFMIRRAQGRVGEIVGAVLQAIEQHPGLAAWRTALPLVRLAAGDEPGARAELEALVDRLDELPPDFFWLTAMAMLSEAAGALGAAGPAERLYGALVPYAGLFVQLGYAAGEGPVARSLGVLAAARGDTAAAVVHFEDALRRSAGAPAFEARARADLSAVRRAGTPRGRADRARSAPAAGSPP